MYMTLCIRTCMQVTLLHVYKSSTTKVVMWESHDFHLGEQCGIHKWCRLRKYTTNFWPVENRPNQWQRRIIPAITLHNYHYTLILYYNIHALQYTCIDYIHVHVHTYTTDQTTLVNLLRLVCLILYMYSVMYVLYTYMYMYMWHVHSCVRIHVYIYTCM